MKVKSIKNLKCPICERPGLKEISAGDTRHYFKIVCVNEHYTHLQWAGHHMLVRTDLNIQEEPLELLTLI